MSVLNEEEFVNYKAAGSFHDHSNSSINDLPSTSTVQSTFSNERPLSVVNESKSTIEVQQCDEDSSKTIVTFDRVVS